MLIYLLFIYSYVTLCRTENEIDIEDAGVGFIAPDDIAMIFYVTLKNNCDRSYEISVCMLQCCETTKSGEEFCGHMTLIGGYMGVLSTKSTKNVTLIYPNMYPFSRQGMCTVAIKYQNQNSPQQISTEVEFRNLNCEDSQQCPTLDLDPMQNCNPVECVAKYSGGKNFFNSRTRECECIPVCTTDPCNPQIAYSIADNNCINIRSTMNMTDLELLEKNEVEVMDCEQTLMNTVVCHNGYLDTSGQCICHNDWVTTTDDEIYEPSLLLYHMCNIETGAWSCINKGRIKTTALLIAILAITIASKILILMCILNWFYRRCKRPNKICSHKLDPEDEAILLCQDLSGAELCICESPPKSKKNLRSQTVNVGFYPCQPSGYSSVRVSSYTDRSRYHVKSEQSIVLSHTTSSSMPVSFQSTTDATEESEDMEEVEEEEDYDIEFSGEEEGDFEDLESVVCVPEDAYVDDDKSKVEDDVRCEEDKSELSGSGGASCKGTEESVKQCTSKASSKTKSPSTKSKVSAKSAE